MNIIITGFPKCGKTTLGKLVAQRLNWEFIDTDRLVEDFYEKEHLSHFSVREIYRKIGEEEFRLLEFEVLKSLQSSKNKVISIGGGSVMKEENRILIKKLGTVIYLKTTEEILWERTIRGTLPIYLDPYDPKIAFQKLIKKRAPIYEEIADLIILTEKLTKNKIVDEMISHKIKRS